MLSNGDLPAMIPHNLATEPPGRLMPELMSYRVRLNPASGDFQVLPDENIPPAALVALRTTPSRAQIERLEHHLAEYPQVEMPPVHWFADGLYAREITIPADTLMTGAVHKEEHVSIMLSGDMTVLTENGMQRVQGPKVFISPPGTKRVGYAHTETRWITVHTNPDNERDVDVIVDRLTESSAIADVLRDRMDYANILAALEITDETVRKQVETEDDLIPMPAGFNVEVKPSKINGLGLFVTGRYEPGQIIAPARIDAMRTPAGRYTNHSANPNAEYRTYRDGNLDLVARELIDGTDVEVTIDYRAALALAGVNVPALEETCQ